MRPGGSFVVNFISIQQGTIRRVQQRPSLQGQPQEQKGKKEFLEIY